jgi:hypothetical protein
MTDPRRDTPREMAAKFIWRATSRSPVVICLGERLEYRDESRAAEACDAFRRALAEIIRQDRGEK